MTMSDHTGEKASKRQLPRFLLPKTYGEGSSSSQGGNRGLQKVVSSLTPVKLRRKMIDLEIPADQYLDMDENDEKNSLDLLADLNEPLNCQEPEPFAPYGRNNADAQGQNGLMAGHAQSSQRRAQLYLPSHSVPVLSTNSFQPPSNVNKFSGKRAYRREMEVRSRNPQVLYDSLHKAPNGPSLHKAPNGPSLHKAPNGPSLPKAPNGPSLLRASNGPSLHNVYSHDFVRPWSHWSSSSRENPRSSLLQQNPHPVQTNPSHTRAGPSFEMRSNGASSSAGFKPTASSGEAVQHQSVQSRLEGLSWLKPKSSCQSGFFTRCLDLNAFMGETYPEPILKTVPPHKGLRYASCSNKGNMGRAEMIDAQSSRNILGMNLPFGGKSVSVDQEGENKPANFKHYIDLNSAPLESEEKGKSLDEHIKVAAQALVAISSCDRPELTNAQDPLFWFAEVINFYGNEFARKVDGSSVEIDDFEEMTLKLWETKKGDYMPEPLVPEHLKLGTDCNGLRKGQARRGRAKQDFRRDVLPWITSLSRQEVTEDILLFGGLLKSAMGVGDSKHKILEKPRRRPRRQRRTPSTFIFT